ncbi:MAG TPA: hypothetical protein DCR97_04035 [Deltaproteobacteria bacterium]|nr:hypothetical protein [Deltaproteobacteria bacterium]
MDAKRLSHEILTELRKRAVTSVEEGQSPEVVAGVDQLTKARVGTLRSIQKSPARVRSYLK